MYPNLKTAKNIHVLNHSVEQPANNKILKICANIEGYYSLAQHISKVSPRLFRDFKKYHKLMQIN